MNTRDLFTRYVLDQHALTATQGKAVEPASADESTPVNDSSTRPVDPAYPPVIVMQGRQRGLSVPDGAGQVAAYAGLGVLGLVGLAVVALVAVAVAIAAITSAVAVVAIKAIAASSQSNRRWSR